MSNTYKDKIRGKLRRISRKSKDIENYFSHFDSLDYDQQSTIANYNRNPSWYNRLINNIPKKRHDKILCKIVKDTYNTEQDKEFSDNDFLFSDDKKPSSWYW